MLYNTTAIITTSIADDACYVYMLISCSNLIETKRLIVEIGALNQADNPDGQKKAQSS